MDRPDQPAINHGQTRKTRPQALLSAFKINYRRDGASGLRHEARRAGRRLRLRAQRDRDTRHSGGPTTVTWPPSSRRRRRGRSDPPDRAPAIDATAERLPFDDDSIDAAMATVTIHQWSDLDTGLREVRRLSRGVVAILTFDAPALEDFWPGVIAIDQQRFPAISHIVVQTSPCG